MTEQTKDWLDGVPRRDKRVFIRAWPCRSYLELATAIAEISPCAKAYGATNEMLLEADMHTDGRNSTGVGIPRVVLYWQDDVKRLLILIEPLAEAPKREPIAISTEGTNV